MEVQSTLSPLPTNGTIPPTVDPNELDDEVWEWEEFQSILEEDLPHHAYHTTKTSGTKDTGEKLSRRELMMKGEIEVEKAPLIETKKYRPAEDLVLRAPVACVLGHVDAGKTTLLDALRRSNVQIGEAGGITQQIGATMVPIEEIQLRTARVNDRNVPLRIPGILFFDTPGHESFSNMRVRGSSLCDIAVVAVDIFTGLQPQTIESLKLLRKGQTRFVVALNKIDRLNEWKDHPNVSVRESLRLQEPGVQKLFQERLSAVRAELADHGVKASLYWRCKDLDIQTAIVPLSAVTQYELLSISDLSCGVADLLLFISLYSQSILATRIEKKDHLECYILEVQQTQGLGTTIDVLLLHGELKVGDKIILCSFGAPVTTTIRSLVVNKSMVEMKGKIDRKTDTENQYREVQAVQGLKIVAKNLESAMAGSRLYIVKKTDNIMLLQKIVIEQVEALTNRLKLSREGSVRVHASTLGSLEALLDFLNDNGVSVASIGLGTVNARDVTAIGRSHRKYEASSEWTSNSNTRGMGKILLAFDVRVTRQAHDAAVVNDVEIIERNVIYQLLDEFRRRKARFLQQRRDTEEAPCVLAIDPNYIIKEYDPLILGVTVLLGQMTIGTSLYLIDGTYVGDVETIRNLSSGISTDHGEVHQQYIIQLGSWGASQSLVYGRDIYEDDRFYAKIDRRTFGQLVRDARTNKSLVKFVEKYRGLLGIPDDDDIDV